MTISYRGSFKNLCNTLKSTGLRSVAGKRASSQNSRKLSASSAPDFESALLRPQTGYYPTLIDEASALWESLSQNHPFVDGNKRTAFAATYVFLAINGLDIITTGDEAQGFVLGLYATSSVTFDNLRSWLGENTKALCPAHWNAKRR